MIEILVEDSILSQKMIILSGPRQVGKTFISKMWLQKKSKEKFYYNFDSPIIKKKYQMDPVFFENELRNSDKVDNRIVIDEIHKYKNWKNILKGYFDEFYELVQFLITGSARLDLFKKSGDSLAGRYFLIRVWPLSLFEVLDLCPTNITEMKKFQKEMFSIKLPENSNEKLLNLISFGGFPEPFIKSNKRFSKLWLNEYLDRIIKEDARDLSRILDLDRVELIYQLLSTKVGSTLSINSLRQDLLCSHDAVTAGIKLLEKLFLIVQVPIWSKKIKNSILKEKKVYLLNWAYVEDEAFQFENYIAIELFNFCQFVTDSGLSRFELFYLRNKKGAELDFLIVREKKPICIVEVKLNEEKITNNFKVFSEIGDEVLKVQVIKKSGVYKILNDIHLLSADRFIVSLWQLLKYN